MAQPIFKKGETRCIRLANGVLYYGFHSRMERRWERIQIRVTEGIFYAWYSRATGKIDPDPNKSTIVAHDPGYLHSHLIDPK